MELEIRRHNIHLSDAMKDHIERRLEFALGQFNSRLGSVAVHVEDVNGPKGGIDKQCRILVTLPGGKVIKVEELDAEVTAAVDRAADRIGHAVRREIDRSKAPIVVCVEYLEISIYERIGRLAPDSIDEREFERLTIVFIGAVRLVESDLTSGIECLL